MSTLIAKAILTAQAAALRAQAEQVMVQGMVSMNEITMTRPNFGMGEFSARAQSIKNLAIQVEDLANELS